GSLEAKVQAILVRRMRLATYLSLGSFALFLANDIVGNSPHLPILVTIKVVQFAVSFAILFLLRDERALPNALLIALGSTLFFAVAATFSAILRGNPNGHLLLLTAVAIGTATLYPWGVRPQAIMVGTCILLLCVAFQAVDGSLLPLVTNPSFVAVL